MIALPASTSFEQYFVMPSTSNQELFSVLQDMDLGESVAELDDLLFVARVETSAFSDLFSDKVDLVPGTKGSGKSALFRIFVELLPQMLLDQRKVVIAHGVYRHGDEVFHAFNDRFDELSEDEFVSFWSIFFVSLVHEHFIKGERYQKALKVCERELRTFRAACAKARIPEVEAQKSLRDILEWGLNVLTAFRVKWTPPDAAVGSFELALSGPADKANALSTAELLPRYINEIAEALEAILVGSDLTIWLMLDRLDEIFPRRSELEKRALRGLLRAMRYFSSPRIRVKVFLRDDMLESVVAGEEGFTALSHLTARRAATLRWGEDEILSMVVNRLFSNENLSDLLEVDTELLSANRDYQRECFYRVFPNKVHKGTNQSMTLRWIYSHVQDGRNVVTPRDVIELLKGAIQYQQDEFRNSSGKSQWVIGPKALQHGLHELSKHKKTTVLDAEFPHLSMYINKLVGTRTTLREKTLRRLLGDRSDAIVEDLLAIGLLTKKAPRNGGGATFQVANLYRKGLELTQGTI